MKLINNRYKLDRVVYDSLYSSLYQGFDLWENDKKIYLKLYNSGKRGNVIDYFINNFIILSKINHENLLLNYQFDIISTIDSKKVNIKQYFSTIEYIDAPTLDEVYLNFNFHQRLNILIQVANVLDFLHYKGIIYRYLSPTNIFVLEDGSIKLMDLATIHDNIINTEYDDLTRSFIAPEVLLEQKDIINENADKYSFGMLILYLLTENFHNPFGNKFDYIGEFQLNSLQEDFLNHIINSFIMKNPNLRDYKFRDLIDALNRKFNMNFQYDLVKERGVLDFHTKIVGREKQINRILHFDQLITSGDIDNKIVLIKGNTGTGKTRLLKEISHLLRLKGRDVYSTEISLEDSSELKPMTNILRQTIKDTPKIILDKYAQELYRIVPELKPALDMNNSIVLNGDKERLRLFDRTANYLGELSQSQPIYLIIDNLEKCSLQLLYMIDYIINNMRNGKIIIVASYNEKVIPENSEKKDIILKWTKNEIVEEMQVTNFDLAEIGEYIQYILGISYKPLKFSAVILKESQGNPKYIEYLIKDLYANGELFFSTGGYWEVKAKKYSDIYFSANLGETLESQLNLIKDEHMDIMKVVSVYYDAVSKNTLQSILDIDSDILNKNLNELIAMRLLDVRVSDWGYSYSINDIRLKRNIYYKIAEEERIKIHEKIAKHLEKNYPPNYKAVMGEFIHHLMCSNQKIRALEFIINEAKEEELYSSQSVLLWEEAYEIDKELKSEYRMEILKNLGNIYATKGENDKALDIYNELFQEAIKSNEIEYAIISNNGMADIYIKRNFLELAIEKIEESTKLSKKINNLDLLVESKILQNRILLENGQFEETNRNMNQLLEFSLENKLDKNLGNIYNILGLIEFYNGNMDKALNRYEESIEAFQKVGDLLNSTKPINNIANIYTQYGKNEKAMEYYEKGLSVVKNRGILHFKLIFLNNIGSTYMAMYEYDKAIKYMEAARVIAIEIEDANLEFLTNMNLSIIYLLIGNYEQSYNYYTMLEEVVNDNNYSFEIISYYYNFLSEFYFAFGEFHKAMKYSKMAIENLEEFSINEYMASKTRIALIEFFGNNTYNRESIEKIRAEYREQNIDLDRRYALLYLAFIPLIEGDYEYLMDLLNEEDELRGEYSIPKLDYIRGILTNSLGDDDESIENLIKLEANMKKHNLPQLDLVLNIILGMKFSKKGKYYEGINCLLETQDTIYSFIKNIPCREFQKGFIKRFYGDIIKEEISKMVYEITNKKINTICIDEIKSQDKIEKYFDYRPLIELMNDEDFAKIREVSRYINDDVKDIESLDILISKLTSNYKTNLELILKFLAKETFAIRGYILGYDEDTNKYLPIISLDGNNDWTPNENLLSLANRYEDGILINNNIHESTIEFHREFLSKGTRALMCIPIGVKDSKTIYVGEDRRKSSYYNQINEGYIYLETERVFNRFDKTRHRLVYSLTPIIYINLENYKLKILSTIDKLTGTNTRKHFEQEYNKIFDDARKNQRTFAVLMLDIDSFKEINDTYGHRKGDEVLSEIGKNLKNSIRSTDLVARYGGEEFVIILKNITEEEAMKIGEKIRVNIENIRVPKVRETITISIGIAMFPQHGQFKEELIEKADQALYHAKEEGKNKVVVWDSHLFNTLHRVDRLAGIISGNINQDQRNVLAILDIIDLVKENINKEEKIFKFLGRLIETIEAESCTLIYLDKDKNPIKTYSRMRQSMEWEEEPFINYNIVKKVAFARKGEFSIDWENINDVDLILNSPNWKSIIVHPIEFNGKIKAIIYITVPLREKEFDYDCYNMVKTLSGVFSPIV